MALPVALLAGAGTLLGGIASNIFSAREAQKNREFQERLSSTAQQRGVADLRAAGLNPILAARGGGASTPGGDSATISDAVGPAVSSALSARLLRAQIGLVEAQTQREEDSALLTRTQAGDIQMRWNAGQFERLVSERELASLTVQEKRQMIPIAIQRAQAEVASITSSARASAAKAALDELARTGSMNVEAFERDVGELGPALRFLIQLLRGVRQ